MDPMSEESRSSQYDRIISLFREISALDDDQQQQRLSDIADPAIRREVERRIAQHKQLLVGRSLEMEFRYEVGDEIGRGGVGIVYKARQTTLDRHVALKIFPHISSQLAEGANQLLESIRSAAALDHPGIVKIYDSGVRNGQLFIATEYVDGPNLAEMTSNRPVPTSQCVEWFSAISSAVAYAHRNEIIHCDLKPENVLLDSDGNPHVGDFDLIRRFDSVTNDATKAGVAGTPSYMSPEQAHGQNMGPESDVFSLGAILYTMLTGRPPFLAPSAEETIHDVIHREAVLPRSLNPRIPRDLETICLKCLRKSAHQRYRDAGVLAEDLRRYAGGEPISARPVSSVERIWKWAKRNRRISALACLSGVAVVLGVVATLWQANHAEVARRRAESNLSAGLDVLGFINGELVDPDLVNSPQIDRVRRRILEKNLQFYENLLATNDPTSQLLQGGTIYVNVGDIRFALGQLEAAENAFRDAVRLHTSDDLHSAKAGRSRRVVLRAWNSIGNVEHDLGELGEWNEALESIEAILETYKPHERETPEYLEAFAALRGSQARRRLKLGEFAVAERLCRDSLKAFTTLVEISPERADHRDQLAGCWSNLGNILKRTGTPEQVKEAYDAGLRIYKDLAEAFPNERVFRGRLATAHRTLALFHKQQKRVELAAEHYQKAHDILDQLVTDHPASPDYRHELAETLNGVSAMIGAADAIPLLEKAVALQRVARELAPQNTAYAQKLSNYLNQLAFAHGDSGDHYEAATYIKESLSLSTRAADRIFGAYLLFQCGELAAIDSTLTDAARETLRSDYVNGASSELIAAKESGQLARGTIQLPLFTQVRESEAFMELVRSVFRD